MWNERYRSISEISRAEAFHLFPSILVFNYIKLRLGNKLFRRVPLSRESIDVAAIRLSVLGVDGVLVTRRSASDERSARRVCSGDRAIRDPVVVHVEVATELSSELLERLAGGFAASIVARKIGSIVASSIAVAIAGIVGFVQT